MVDASKTNEVMKRAKMLVNTKGEGAIEHANRMLQNIRKTGDEEDSVYWQKIVMQVELLVEGNDPGKNSPI